MLVTRQTPTTPQCSLCSITTNALPRNRNEILSTVSHHIALNIHTAAHTIVSPIIAMVSYIMAPCLSRTQLHTHTLYCMYAVSGAPTRITQTQKPIQTSEHMHIKHTPVTKSLHLSPGQEIHLTSFPFVPKKEVRN